jgi:hypothetical protein
MDAVISAPITAAEMQQRNIDELWGAVNRRSRLTPYRRSKLTPFVTACAGSP